MGTQNLEECRIGIGDFCCSLACKDADVAGRFREYYRGFLVDGREPDFVIELDVVNHLPDSYSVPETLFKVKEVDGNSFNFGTEILKGTLYPKLCKITINQILLRGYHIRTFEHFLYQIYYTILSEKNPRPVNYLIHSSGVIRNGKGYIFSGRPGRGKTTIARLSTEETVVNDEIVLVEKRGDGFVIRGTPFNGYFWRKENASAPLKAVFLLEHAKENKLTRLSKADFVKRFINEVLFSAPLLSKDVNNTISDMMDFCGQLTEKIPVYQLGFKPDRSFWECIDAEEAKD